MFNGGRSTELLRKVFDAGVGPAPIEEVAAIFEGLWEVKPDGPGTDLNVPVIVSDEMAVAALEDLAAEVRKRAPEHGGIGHNGPPHENATLIPSDRVSILRATEDAKLAVLSKDQMGIQAGLWMSSSRSWSNSAMAFSPK